MIQFRVMFLYKKVELPWGDKIRVSPGALQSKHDPSQGHVFVSECPPYFRLARDRWTQTKENNRFTPGPSPNDKTDLEKGASRQEWLIADFECFLQFRAGRCCAMLEGRSSESFFGTILNELILSKWA
jgi:hypothetical protein